MKLTCYFIILSITFLGCKEIYAPEVNSDLSILTVDGLLTDNAKSYNIQLRMAKSFDSSGIGIPVSDAEVNVTDDMSNIYPFNATANGRYVTDNSVFAIQPGRKYTLHILTTDGNKYESSSQELIQNKDIDKIYGCLTKKTYATENYYGETVQKNYEGIETFIDFFSNPGQSYAFKFNVTLLIEYTYFDSIKYFAWRKYDLNQNINLTDNKFEKENQEIIGHPLSFFPTEKSLYNIQEQEVSTLYNVVHWILIVDQFRLNKDSYSFYKKTKDQLAAEGKLFDPIAVQINGNVRCTSNYQKLVLGNFEVSSKEIITYVVLPGQVPNSFSYLKIPNLSNISDEGAYKASPPDWWIF
jgi:hypothetical protein